MYHLSKFTKCIHSKYAQFIMCQLHINKTVRQRLLIILFIYFGLSWVFVAAQGFSSCGEPELHFSCGAWASHCSGFSHCGAWALCAWASVVTVHRLSSCLSWAPQHVESSQTRDGTSAPYIGRWILIHWTTREAPECHLIWSQSLYKGH